MKKELRSPVTVGHRGYLKKKKTKLLIRALILFLGAFGLILTGYLTTGSVKNWLTVVGLVTAIPFAMMTATLISMLKYKAPEEQEYEKVKTAVSNAVFDTEILIANKDGPSYYFPYVLFHETGIYGFLSDPKPDSKHVSEYVGNYLRLNGVETEFTVFQDLPSFLKRIGSLTPSDRETVPETVLKQEGVFRAISM